MTQHFQTGKMDCAHCPISYHKGLKKTYDPGLGGVCGGHQQRASLRIVGIALFYDNLIILPLTYKGIERNSEHSNSMQMLSWSNKSLVHHCCKATVQICSKDIQCNEPIYFPIVYLVQFYICQYHRCKKQNCIVFKSLLQASPSSLHAFSSFSL